MVTHIYNTPIPKKYQRMIEQIDYDEDGYWIMLARPYLWQGDTSFVHENTISQCLDELRHGVAAVDYEIWDSRVNG